jgi:hypothetical protein
MGVVILPKMVKEQEEQAAIGLTGMVEDNSRQKIGQELGRPCKIQRESQNAAGNVFFSLRKSQ